MSKFERLESHTCWNIGRVTEEIKIVGKMIITYDEMKHDRGEYQEYLRKVKKILKSTSGKLRKVNIAYKKERI